MKKISSPILYTALVAILSITAMLTYLNGTLGNNINAHFLPAKMFGVPDELVEKGIQPLYWGEKETGWDGQFYYYMSNDLFGLKDSPEHIDAPSYRYQRIGLSLYAAVVAKLAGQSWVSPLVFYLSYLALILSATWAAALVVKDRGGYALAGFLWAAGVGTQVTLLNALPDAAADAFLILATFAILKSRQWIGAILLAMAALSRESYVIFPAAYFGWLLWKNILHLRSESLPKFFLRLFRNAAFMSLALPLGAFVVWQLYVRLHFGIAPSEQAHGILGLPFKAWAIALQAGLSGNHYLVPSGIPSYFEGVSQIFFMLMLFITFALAVMVLRKGSRVHEWVRALALGGGVLVLLYVCFGRTVAMHYTGYMKAGNLFLFLIPLFLAEVGLSFRRQLLVYILLIVVVVVTSLYLWRDRILPQTYTVYSRYIRSGDVSRTDDMACLKTFDAGVSLVGAEDVGKRPLLSFGSSPRSMVLWVDLKNRSMEKFISTHGSGSVNMSYHWLSNNGTVVKDGIRSMIPEGVPVGGAVRVPVVVEFPEKEGDYILRLTPVQEGCSWFYVANPSSALDLRYKIR